MGDAPFDTLENACKWMADAGYKGVQIPSDNPVCIDLKQAAESQDYCDEYLGKCKEWGVEVTELSTHIQGQLVAVHPAYDTAFDAFAPAHLHGKPDDRQKWAVEQVMFAAKASERMGLKNSVSFPGALVWPFMYPWPQRPAGGDGQIDFKGIFSKLSAYDFDGWAVVEWECALKHNQDGAREGARFVNDHIIRVTDKAFDDFAGGAADTETNRKMLGLS